MEKRPALGKGLSALIPDAPDTLADTDDDGYTDLTSA